MTIDSKLINGDYYFPVDGHFVSQKQVRINEILRDYDPNLQLQWIPEGQRSESDMAFRVVCFPPGRSPYAVCFAKEADERLLANVFRADQDRSGARSLSWLENYERARDLVKAKEQFDQRQEDHEIAAAVWRNNKSHFRIKGRDGEMIDLERPGYRHKSTTYIW